MGGYQRDSGIRRGSIIGTEVGIERLSLDKRIAHRPSQRWQDGETVSSRRIFSFCARCAKSENNGSKQRGGV